MNSSYNKYVRYSSMVIQMVVFILLAVWAGKKVDEWLGNEKPYVTLALTIIAIFGALYYLVKKTKQQDL